MRAWPWVRSSETDRVAHLRGGADDYVTKPFSLDELCARIAAVLRRSEPSIAPTTVRLGDVTVDLDGHTVRRGESVETLSTLEAAILACLLERRGRATSRREILDRVWGRYATVSDRTIDFHVKNLRRKLEREPERPRLLVTDHGVGYRLTL
jgi:DNA-binding response OmpR family regulator